MVYVKVKENKKYKVSYYQPGETKKRSQGRERKHIIIFRRVTFIRRKNIFVREKIIKSHS